MKKLISAVTAICMTATMFAAAVPVSVNAVVDTTKGYSLRTVDMETCNSTGNTYTVTAEEIAAGDVVIPCGLYLEEETEAECAAILATFGISNTKSQNMTDIQIDLMSNMSDAYYDTAKTYTTSEGVTFSTAYLPSFSATVKTILNSTTYAPSYTNQMISEEDYRFFSAIDDNVEKVIVFNWISLNNSVWLGATSDEYAMCYFNVTLSQNAEPGTYVIDFYDFYKDLDDFGTKYQCSNQIGSSNTSYEYTSLVRDNPSGGTQDEGTLELKPLTIIVEGDETDTSGGDGDQIDFWYDYDNGWNSETGLDYYQAKAGDEVIASFMVDSHDLAIIAMDAGVTLDDPLVFSAIEEYSPAFNTNFVVNWMNSDGEAANSVTAGTILVDSEGNKVSAKFNATTGKSVIVDGEGDYVATVPDASTALLYFYITVPDDTPDGTYYINPAYITVLKDNFGAEYTNINFETGVIVVGDDTTTTTTTTETTTTTTTTTVTITTTTGEPATVDPSGRLLGDANENGVVNVADVVVLNRYLAGTGTLTDQGKINAEVSTPTYDVGAVSLDSEDATYIIQSIIHLWDLTDSGPVATEYNK
ncbi:MAG: hypothetical protein LUG26_05160 [Ruminococcus sp.]|nr:hypothetical protein [Ruminococcus sp.]